MFDVALCGVHAAPERSCECMACAHVYTSWYALWDHDIVHACVGPRAKRPKTPGSRVFRALVPRGASTREIYGDLL